jgi:6-phosphofructokinase 1
LARYGILTAGGDCPGLNAVLRATGKTLLGHGHELIGFEDGFLGIMNRRYRVLNQQDLSGILTIGGTILGTSNRDNPFKWCAPEALLRGEPQVDCSDHAVEFLHELGIKGLIVIGGDGSLNIAHRLQSEKNIPCIGVPKTIDNDLQATDVTFGFDTAVQIATECIDRLHSTAMSHHRAMVVEIMGRYAGWLTLHAGVAGGADVILLPEIPYDVRRVCDVIAKRSQVGKRFSILAVSEGAKPLGGGVTVARRVVGSHDPIRLGGIAQRIASEIEDMAGVETRATVLGHIQRGGSPSSMDRLLATGFGHLAAELVLENAWGQMAAYQCGKFVPVEIASAISGLKLVTPDNPLIAAARAIGVSFGDETLNGVAEDEVEEKAG